MSGEDKKSTFCLDCTEDPETCGKNPIDCMNEPEAKVYFSKYDATAGWQNFEGVKA